MTFDIFWTLEYSRVSGASSQQGVFFCRPKKKEWYPATLEPCNLLLGCKAGLRLKLLHGAQSQPIS